MLDPIDEFGEEDEWISMIGVAGMRLRSEVFQNNSSRDVEGLTHAFQIALVCRG